MDLAFVSATPQRKVVMGCAGAAEVEAGRDPSKYLPTLYVIVVGKTAIGSPSSRSFRRKKQKETEVARQLFPECGQIYRAASVWT